MDNVAIGEAGFEKPQDCRIIVRMKDEDGLNITLHSKQEKMFGSAIRESVVEEAERLGVKNADIEVFDYSSLDFVIRARIKTAVKRAESQR